VRLPEWPGGHSARIRLSGQGGDVPLAFIFLAVALFSFGTVRKAVRRVLVSAVAFLAIASPFSRAKGGPDLWSCGSGQLMRSGSTVLIW